MTNALLIVCGLVELVLRIVLLLAMVASILGFFLLLPAALDEPRELAAWTHPILWRILADRCKP